MLFLYYTAKDVKYMFEEEFNPIDKDYYQRTFLSKKEKNLQQQRRECKHQSFYTKCGICGEILASDIHIRHHNRNNNKFIDDIKYKDNYKDYENFE